MLRTPTAATDPLNSCQRLYPNMNTSPWVFIRARWKGTVTDLSIPNQVETDLVRTLTSADQLVIPAEVVLAAYKRDFGTSRCASRAEDYNSFRRTQRVRKCPPLVLLRHKLLGRHLRSW